METGPQTPDSNGEDMEAAHHPARMLSLHLLRMFETRLEAAGLVVQTQCRRLISRLQLQILAAAAVFIALWGGIVLLAIALPPHLRIPVLAGVIAAFVLGAAFAWIKAKNMVAGEGIGSLHWLLDSFKKDLEVWARSLAPASAAVNDPPQAPPDPDQPVPPTEPRSPPSDLAA